MRSAKFLNRWSVRPALRRRLACWLGWGVAAGSVVANFLLFVELIDQGHTSMYRQQQLDEWQDVAKASTFLANMAIEGASRHEILTAIERFEGLPAFTKSDPDTFFAGEMTLLFDGDRLERIVASRDLLDDPTFSKATDDCERSGGWWDFSASACRFDGDDRLELSHCSVEAGVVSLHYAFRFTQAKTVYLWRNRQYPALDRLLAVDLREVSSGSVVDFVRADEVLPKFPHPGDAVTGSEIVPEPLRLRLVEADEPSCLRAKITYSTHGTDERYQHMSELDLESQAVECGCETRGGSNPPRSR